MPKTTHVYVFVYGTLKVGFPLNKWMAHSDLIGPDKVYRHALVSLGAYPAMLFTDNPDHCVEGEVFRMPIEDFRQLRAMEEKVGYETERISTTEGRPCYTFVYMALPAGQYSWTDEGLVKRTADDDDIPF